jgi:hypothetical protein
MRYQEPIYIQNENEAVRNKDILNVNMSSDIVVFGSPSFSLSGASKLPCGVDNPPMSYTFQTYMISANTQTIPLTFDFTGDTTSLVGGNASFKFEIYKYTPMFSGFSSTPVYKSPVVPYSSFSGTNMTSYSIPVNVLVLDGDYLIKPYYELAAPTSFLKLLGKTLDTKKYISGNKFGLYNDEFDYYFVAVKNAEKPFLTENSSNFSEIGQLKQDVRIPTDNQTIFVIQDGYIGNFVFTLNGLALANGYDYTFSGNIVTLNAPTYATDIVTIIYGTSGGSNLFGDTIDVTSAVVSGVTDGQGSNTTYFNTTTGKYEIYTSVTPKEFNSLIVMINGATLANGVDFYQSITNPKRIILEGDIMIGDIITIVYFPSTSTSQNINTNTPNVSWGVNTAPLTIDGHFTLEVANDVNFNSYYYTGTTDYIYGNNYYAHSFIASGTVGTNLYYRVKNTKNYTTICGDVITSTAYSDTIPLIIQTNSINSY